MSCACRKAKREQKLSEAKQVQAEPAIEVEQVEEAKLPIVDDIKPTTQCIACAQKHLDEAWTMFHEYGYSNENRRFVRGNLRAIVLHTYLEWKSIATLARSARCWFRRQGTMKRT